LRDQLEDTVEIISTIKEQIKYFDGWLSTHWIKFSKRKLKRKRFFH
jgi:hypothetical protein